MINTDELRDRARATLDPAAWQYLAGTAGASETADRDALAWHAFDLVPRFLRGLASVDTAARIGADELSTPVMVAATAAHRLAHPDAEIATAAGASAAGALMVYSSSATLEVGEFARSVTGPWWAQVYLMRDRERTRDYLRRVVAAGASALVLTVDYVGVTGTARFGSATSTPLPVRPGNYPGLSWPEMTAGIEPDLTIDDIDWVATQTGLPVWVKGVLHPADAALLAARGVAGIIVSNHGRRQLDGVLPTAHALGPVVSAVAGRVPVLVDGGIRSGADVARALALGAAGVGIGRPVLWALAAGGAAGVELLLRGLTTDLRQVMASLGAASVAGLTPDLLRRRSD
ncbi:alpha-hydroxy acid oxidase [Nakamurella lactea]|uniref:alpha-hydroxy acid oxidase n=1 Tax=Nakamurella lactea TaxID=459515 RepID=UPI0004132C85|nr:alpha-hydroxy acid oxidase [Nakamurella lactea]